MITASKAVGTDFALLQEIWKKLAIQVNHREKMWVLPLSCLDRYMSKTYQMLL
jgi:hypothetical protein